MKERLSTRKTLQRERLSSLNTCQRENHAFSHSPLRGRVLWGTLGTALVLLVALVVLVACPAANNGGGGPGGGSQYRYTCANGTGADATFDASAGGLIRCVSCNAGYASFNEVCLPSYVCVNGVASDESADSVGQSRCASCSPIATLDGTADSIGTTCRANVMLGEAVRIGMAMQFGVSETSPYGLAAIGDTLYMVGDTNDVLYTLDTTTGGAAQVGSTDAGFGVSETNPRGLAAIGNTLYMVTAGSGGALYTLSTTTGRAARVSDASVIQFGVGAGFPNDLAAIDDTLYMVTAGGSNALLYTLSTTTGSATLMSGTGVSQFGVGEGSPAGLAAIGNTLYMVGLATDALYTLNIDTTDGTEDGTAIPVGSGVTEFGVSENNPTGLAAIGSTLYMMGLDVDALYALRYQ